MPNICPSLATKTVHVLYTHACFFFNFYTRIGHIALTQICTGSDKDTYGKANWEAGYACEGPKTECKIAPSKSKAPYECRSIVINQCTGEYGRGICSFPWYCSKHTGFHCAKEPLRFMFTPLKLWAWHYPGDEYPLLYREQYHLKEDEYDSFAK